LSGGDGSITISGRHVVEEASIIVDGRRVQGTVRCESGTLPHCSGERIVVELERSSVRTGTHLLQVQNPDGLFSNELIVHFEPSRRRPARRPGPASKKPSAMASGHGGTAP